MRILVMCLVCIGCGAGELLPPRGLQPAVRLAPEGSDGPGLRVRALLAGRPLNNFILRVRASRTSREVIWSGVSDEEGLLDVRLPAETATRRLALKGHVKGARMPVWSQLTWDSPQEFGIHGDSTPQIGTSTLNMWQLKEEGAHVFFDWAQHQAAEKLLGQLLEQRRRTQKILGVRLEPMGAVLVVHEHHLDRFRTVTGNHTMRHGQWIHGVRSWPLFGATLKDIRGTFDEDRELNITLPHELAENSLIFAESAGVAHEGTRWYRDGVAETAACFCAWDRPKLLAEHLRTRVTNLEENDEKTLNLLEWQQDSNSGTLARYAAATAWVITKEREQPGLIAKVTRKALKADRMGSPGLVAALSKATKEDCDAQLRAVSKAEAVAQLKAVIADLEAGKNWVTD